MLLLNEVLAALSPDVSEGDFIDILQGTNIPGLLPLGAVGAGSMYFVIRWMVKLQREFTDVYVNENKKLREEVDGLKQDIRDRDETIIELRTEVGDLRNQVADHERTIGNLNKIIERRKLNTEESTP